MFRGAATQGVKEERPTSRFDPQALLRRKAHPQQVHGVETQGICELSDIIDAEVALTALDPADVGVVHPAQVGEFFLGHAASFTNRPQVPRKA